MATISLLTVPAGTFLAARLNLDLSYEFTGELSGPEKDYQVKVKQDNQFSYWAVPGMGIVKSIEKGTASVSIPGEGCAKASATVTRTLSEF